MSFKNKKVLIVGFRRSGVACATFLADRGALVTVTDSSDASVFKGEIATIGKREVRLVLGGHDKEDFINADLIVVSPGVPLYIPEIKRAIKAGVEVISEMELAFRFIGDIPVLAITGTNGKTTTASLLASMLKENGGKVFLGGNIGNPFIKLAGKSRRARPDAAVVEVSSFQLEAAPTFRPHIASVINVSPDHQDRYKSFKDYQDAKANIFRNQDKNDWAIINEDCKAAASIAKGLKAKKIKISQKKQPGSAARAWAKDGLIYMEMDKRKTKISTKGTKLIGVHNTENILVASSAAYAFGAGTKAIERAILKFKPIAHRMELVRDFGKVRYFNDSKATNIDAVSKSLQSLNSSKAVLLLGGYDKGGDFKSIEPLIKRRARHTVLFGKAAKKIEKQLSASIPSSSVKGLEDAVKCAYEIAEPGDAVLLAPGCASFDEFKDYEERGSKFTQWVRELPSK